jgi:MerR family copper efflux transcriptional regulator
MISPDTGVVRFSEIKFLRMLKNIDIFAQYGEMKRRSMSLFHYFKLYNMLISQLSKKTQVSVQTLRYYEKYGLIKGKKRTTESSNNYSYYDEKNIDKVELIEEGKSIGLSLSEIKELIDVWYNKRISNQRRLDILKKQKLTISGKITQLHDVQGRIEVFITELEKFS